MHKARGHALPAFIAITVTFAILVLFSDSTNLSSSSTDTSFHADPPTAKMKRISVQKGISRLALDVGNVISTSDTDAAPVDPSSSPLDIINNSTPTAECAEAVRLLIHLFGRENSFILSKCGHEMQRATMKFLSRGIDGGPNFFERTGLHRRNVLFCTRRSGGDHCELDDNDLIMANLVDGDDTGARVAVGRVGKGTVARRFGLTHFIDDRDECLFSDMLEGHLMLSRIHHVSTDDQPNSLAVDSATSVDGALIQFGKDARPPDAIEINSFIDNSPAMKSKLINRRREEAIIEDVKGRWIVAKKWEDVLNAFDIRN